jgi:hypothetical protein
MAVEFWLRSISFIFVGKILHGADGFTSPPKEGVLRIFITLKNPSPLAGSEPANFEAESRLNNV